VRRREGAIYIGGGGRAYDAHDRPVPEGMPGVAYRAELAADLAGHPALSVVPYPGLPGHPGHQITAR
jgi:hypothetical protein